MKGQCMNTHRFLPFLTLQLALMDGASYITPKLNYGNYLYIILFAYTSLQQLLVIFALWLVTNPAQQRLLIELSMDNFPCRLNLCPNATNPLIALQRNAQLSVVVPLHQLFVKIITIFRAARNIGLTPALLPGLKGGPQSQIRSRISSHQAMYRDWSVFCLSLL